MRLKRFTAHCMYITGTIGEFSMFRGCMIYGLLFVCRGEKWEVGGGLVRSLLGFGGFCTRHKRPEPRWIHFSIESTIYLRREVS